MVRRLRHSRALRPRAAPGASRRHSGVDGARHRNDHTTIYVARVQRLQWTSGVNVREGAALALRSQRCAHCGNVSPDPPAGGDPPAREPAWELRGSCVGAAWEMPSPTCPDGMVLYTTLVPCFSTHRVLGRACAWRAQTASMWPGAARKTHTLPEVAVSRRRMQARRRVVTISARSSTMKALRLK